MEITGMRVGIRVFVLGLAGALLPLGAVGATQPAQDSQTVVGAASPVAPVMNPCPRRQAGAEVENPPALFSSHGVLTVFFSYQTRQDDDGRTLYCFMTPEGLENPTLHVRPGDRLVINVTNNVPNQGGMSMSVSASKRCGATKMTAASVNIHYHGTNTSPTCHQDEVIHTLINSGESFRYEVAFPADEPPGLYWYHPHVHGISEAAVLGGASGALIVDGMEQIRPVVAGLRQRVLLVRDQNVAGNPEAGGEIPEKDLTLNYAPIAYPANTPAVIQAAPDTNEFWRVGNISADTILDVQLIYDGKAQPMTLVAIDSVPTGTPEGNSGKFRPITVSHLRIPPASRMEFIATMPSEKVKSAALVTKGIDTGPDGDNDPARVLATIEKSSAPAPFASTVVTAEATANDAVMPAAKNHVWPQRFSGLSGVSPVASHVIYFSEVNESSQFFITVDNQTPQLFSPDNPPALTVRQGTVERWVIENRTKENHEFHLHQVHFLVQSQDHFEMNGSKPAPGIEGQMLDTVEVPYWDGNPHHQYPSVTVLVDFRGPDIGDFVFHCHILEHEDGGMMSIIRVVPGTGPVH
jgi:FtsP/CotA-like multicopper oxidase with cupredoxin domain